MSNLETFDMFGKESINDDNIDGKHHTHKDKDPCHRCNSLDTKIHSDCVSGEDEETYWIFLECYNCKLCCIFGGGSS